MRVNPVPAIGRSIVKRKRPSVGETESERQVHVDLDLPVVVEPLRTHRENAFADQYHVDAAFMAHLIATRDAEMQPRTGWQMEPQIGASVYRATAASPRKREVGHVVSANY